ncbi:hypothetical protein [Actinophytocola xinjiangensis]|uniref:hypothetical protein n=1 Tax=Actinophytocola xinjiangensis TaxID=485602 RepID=UPI000A9F1548|nr:hypothetical protein [Actinophytocola xinjiangensis]
MPSNVLRVVRHAAIATVVLATSLATGCSTPVAGQAVPAGSGSPAGDRALVEDYYDELNAAADEGTLDDFLRHTQHPDYLDRLCDLSGLTLHVLPALSTLRADPEWTPPQEREQPRGAVYVLGVSISIRDDGTLLGEQIGSQRVVVLDGRAYGFSPCLFGE